MESDRAETDLGIAADIEERLAEAAAQSAVPKQPKKRFVGRRQATENALRGNTNADPSSIEDSGAIQG